MARTSFPASVSAYLDAMRPYMAEGTLTRKGRNLRVVYEDLKALGIRRAPAALAERDIEALLVRWRRRPSRYGSGLDPATQAKYLADLDGFLAWCGNPVIATMRRVPYVRFPRAVAKPIRVLDAQDLERLRAAAEGIEGFPGSVARFLVAFLPATGLRRKELRLAKLKDLDLARGRILVAHPKGEGSWAVPDFAPVPGFVRPAVEDYLAERAVYLQGAECGWLVPYRRVSDDLGPWSDAMLGQLKGELAKRSGTDFSLKTFRATFAQLGIDGGARTEAVSRALRHHSTRTTETYYARIRADDPFHEIERALSRPARIEPRN